jgi:hypothetical protein
MAATLPDGATLSIATTYEASSKTITSVTNANPAIASSASHGYVNGMLLEVKSGWNRINDAIIRVAATAAGTFAMEGVDATNTQFYTPGSGGGTARAITGFTQISQILEFSTSGGDQQFATFSFLEEDFERQLPSITSAQSITMSIADDTTLPGYVALKAASAARSNRALRLQLRNGDIILYNGIFSLNETPSLTKGSVMAVSCSFSLQGLPVRYRAV